MSKIAITLIIIIIVFIIYLYFPTKLKTRDILINDQEFTIEIATTPRQLTQGLSNRPQLCQNCGMLFIFPTPQILSFWMKDTLIPLDMIFIDQNKTITNIVTTQVGDLSIKKSTSPALYCLELNAVKSKELNLKPGDTINL
jgi:hypothetical protein